MYSPAWIALEGRFEPSVPLSADAVASVPRRERDVQRYLEWVCDKPSPFDHFGSHDRQQRLLVADRAGAIPELAWWPPDERFRFLGVAEWP